MPFKVKVHPQCKSDINQIRATSNNALIKDIQREFDKVKENPFQGNNQKRERLKEISAADVHGKSYRLFYQLYKCCNTPITRGNNNNIDEECEGLIHFFLFTSRQNCKKLYKNHNSLIPKSLP